MYFKAPNPEAVGSPWKIIADIKSPRLIPSDVTILNPKIPPHINPSSGPHTLNHISRSIVNLLHSSQFRLLTRLLPFMTLQFFDRIIPPVLARQFENIEEGLQCADRGDVRCTICVCRVVRGISGFLLIAGRVAAET